MKDSEIDNTFKEGGKAMRRFYLNRIKDETGVSRTGRVLEGVLTQSGKVITEWRPPHSTIGVYNSMKEFMTIHVDCHPSASEVVWIDPETERPKEITLAFKSYDPKTQTVHLEDTNDGRKCLTTPEFFRDVVASLKEFK